MKCPGCGYYVLVDYDDMTAKPLELHGPVRRVEKEEWTADGKNNLKARICWQYISYCLCILLLLTPPKWFLFWVFIFFTRYLIILTCDRHSTWNHKIIIRFVKYARQQSDGCMIDRVNFFWYIECQKKCTIRCKRGLKYMKDCGG